MTPEAQRIAIAKACGIDPVLAANNMCPDYLSDLNACHDFENILDKSQRELYWANLTAIVDSQTEDSFMEFYEIHATAAQRAEAFLKCLNFWKD